MTTATAGEPLCAARDQGHADLRWGRGQAAARDRPAAAAGPRFRSCCWTSSARSAPRTTSQAFPIIRTVASKPSPYMLDGRMRHKDNHGNEGVLVPGSVQWMTAGRGLVHSEMPEQQAGACAASSCG